MGFILKKMLIFSLILFTNCLTAIETSILSDEFVAYHLKAAVEDIEDEDIFNLIAINVENLKYCGTTKSAANELINLIEEGYKIDAFNMAKLIDILQIANALKNTTKTLIAT